MTPNEIRQMIDILMRRRQNNPILVGEGLAAQVGGAELESLGTFLLEGMRVPHHVYACPTRRAPQLH